MFSRRITGAVVATGCSKVTVAAVASLVEVVVSVVAVSASKVAAAAAS